MVYILQTYKHNLITVGQKLWPGRKILNKAKVNSSQNIHQNTTETQKKILHPDLGYAWQNIYVPIKTTSCWYSLSLER